MSQTPEWELSAISMFGEINAHHQVIERSSREMVENVLLAGALLNAIKEATPHGEFGGLVEQHFSGSTRTAQLYMKLAKDLGKLPKNETLRICMMENSIQGVQRAVKAAQPSTTEESSETTTCDDSTPENSESVDTASTQTVDANPLSLNDECSAAPLGSAGSDEDADPLGPASVQDEPQEATGGVWATLERYWGDGAGRALMESFMEQKGWQKIPEELPVKQDKNGIPPTLVEVQAYATEKGWDVDCEYFCDFYAGKGWTVDRYGKQRMKDWKACLSKSRKWDVNQNKNGKVNEDPRGNIATAKAYLAMTGRGDG